MSSRAPAPTEDLTSANITQNVKKTNNQSPDLRARYVFDRLVTHLHDFIRETRLSEAEWTAGVDFLVAAGQASDARRNEVVLLSDTLGVSLLVDAVNHPRSPESGATEGTVLGPFHTHDAPGAESGHVLHGSAAAGPKLLVLATVRDGKSGKPLGGVVCDVWEGDSHGVYDVQDPNRQHPDGRAVLRSAADGSFWFVAVVPGAYPIPTDGPVGAMLALLGRHPNRPAHVHFMLAKEGYDTLVTALYPRGDPFLASDPVFGVKESLVVDVGSVDDVGVAERYGVSVGTKVIRYDFVLVDEGTARGVREEEARGAVRGLGLRLKVVDGLPVPDVD